MEHAKVSPKFIRDLKGRQTGVILSNKDWKIVVEALEDLYDIRVTDEVMNDPNETSIPWEEVEAGLKARSDR